MLRFSPLSQDEVAHRLVAGPGSGAEYRAMNLEVAFYSDPTYLFQVRSVQFTLQARPPLQGRIGAIAD